MKVKVGEKEFLLKTLKLNDWVVAEEKGLDIGRLQRGDFKLKDLRVLCFIALHCVDPEITEEWVGDNITLEDMTLTDKIVNFIMPKGAKKSKTT